MKVDYLVLLQFPLQVSGDEIPAPHTHAGGIGDGCERAEGRGPHGGAKRLIVVHSMYLRAPLHAQARFECTSAFAFIDPD
eukprot:3179605-Pleurochrysis_carterae.AAC.1